MKKETDVRTAAAVCAGRAHGFVRCEDAAASYREPTTGACAMAVCDGGGSFRQAAQASHFQAKSFARYAAQHFEELYAMPDLRGHLSRVLPAMLRSYSRREKLDFRELGATLLLAAVQGDRWFTVHVGDGVILGAGKAGTVRVLSEPENGEESYITSFVNLPLRGEESIRVRRGALGGLRTFLLSSDGLADFLTENPAMTRSMALHYRCGDTAAELPELVQALARQVTMDDCSLGLMNIRTGDEPAGADLRLLVEVSGGVQPHRVCRRKARGRVLRSLRRLLQGGLLQQNTRGEFFIGQNAPSPRRQDPAA